MHLLLGIIRMPVLFLAVFWFIPVALYSIVADLLEERREKKRGMELAEKTRKFLDEEERKCNEECDSTMSITNQHKMETIAYDDTFLLRGGSHKLRIPDEDGNLHTVWSTELDGYGNTYIAGTYDLVHAIIRRDANGERVDPADLDYLGRPRR